VSVRHRWIDSMYHAANAGTGQRTQPGVATRSYVDVLGSWHPTNNTQLQIGVTNAFDVEPPTWTGNGTSDYALYDIMQRRFFVRMTQRF
jgi:iron complex outermembrane recepter protein